MRVAKVIVFLLLSAVTGKATDFLTEGVDNARTGWVRDEKVFTHGQRRQHEAAVEGQAREHAARDAQPVRAAHRRARDDARRARASSPSSPASPTICSASTSRPASRSGTGTSTARWPTRAARTTRSVPADRRPCRRWRRRRREVHRLRRVVGRPAAAGEPGRRQGHRAAREVHPRRRQAVRAQPAQRRDLHRDRAGLRRPDQRVLLVRSRHAPRQRVHSRRRRPVGPPRRVDRSRRHGLSSAPATRSSTR